MPVGCPTIVTAILHYLLHANDSIYIPDSDPFTCKGVVYITIVINSG